MILLDYDGTLIPSSTLKPTPPAKVLEVLDALCTDRKNSVYVISGRAKNELSEWFASVVSVLLSSIEIHQYNKAFVSDS